MEIRSQAFIQKAGHGHFLVLEELPNILFFGVTEEQAIENAGRVLSGIESEEDADHIQ